MIVDSIDLVPAIARTLAMAIGSGAVAAGAAFVYRWYSGTSIPDGVAVLLGISVVALALNTTATLRSSVAANELVGGAAAGYTLAAFATGTIAADAGRRLGERLAADFPSVDSVRTMESDVGSLVRAAGRVVRVRVPEGIEDIDGYEPVPETVKADLAGTVFLFPRRMTLGELRERFVERLKRDYEVGHVDVEFADDGTVEYLAIGRRLAGVGQTLAPGTVAVAIRADPAFSATPGDRVQVWPAREAEPDRENDQSEVAPETKRRRTQPVATGELRAAVGDVATIAVDDGDADALDDDARYRLVTLPATVQPDRELAALLRNAEETMGAVSVEAGSDLDGTVVEALELTVAAVRSDDGVTAIPAGDRTVRAGDTVYVVARPDAIRRLEARGVATAASEDADASESGNGNDADGSDGTDDSGNDSDETSDDAATASRRSDGPEATTDSDD